jgi:hydroxymethylglutaryl-CoA reductase
VDSRLIGFYRLPLEARVRVLAERAGLSHRELSTLSVGGLLPEHADHMAENVVGVFGLPLGLCLNLRVDDRDRIVPMVVEEPSVIAAASHAAKLLRGGIGIRTTVAPSIMVGQIQLLDVADGEALGRTIAAHERALLEKANAAHARLVDAGGGATAIEVHHLPAHDADDPVGPMWILHLVVDVRDAMGANSVNSMCERLAPDIEALTGCRVNLRILTNLCDRRTVVAEGRAEITSLCSEGGQAARDLAQRIVEASVFAERDPYRAATHNKGIMNGVDSVLVALGQDVRAVEAGAHAFASRTGRYTALATWRIEGDELVGRLELPLAVGTVGGIVDVHPTVRVLRKIAEIEDATDLGALAASVGLAQNLAAIRALASEGIQRGHMRLHARNFAVQAGARGAEIDAVARAMADDGHVSLSAAKALVTHRTQPPPPAPRVEREARVANGRSR